MPETWLADLLAMQRSHHGPNRVERSMGDGYLYDHNPIFRRVRDTALALGYQFTPDDIAAYFDFPMVALDDVLATRRIPFRDNLAPLELMEQRRPKHFRLSDFDINRPRPNYLLHEAAHGIAYDALFPRDRDVREALGDDHLLPQLLTGEAFAMTAEYLARCTAADDPLHRWILDNSSYCFHAHKKKRVARLITKLGFSTTVWLLMGSYLLHQFGHETVAVTELDHMLSFDLFVQQSPSGKKQKRRIAKTLSALMGINPAFRDQTTPLFLQKVGYPRDMSEHMANDPLELVARDRRFMDGLHDLIRVLESGPLGDFRILECHEAPLRNIA